jgi:septal ring factor EnvC (AmiA/AmiB activator)
MEKSDLIKVIDSLQKTIDMQHKELVSVTKENEELRETIEDLNKSVQLLKDQNQILNIEIYQQINQKNKELEQKHKELEKDKKINKLALAVCHAITWEKEIGLTSLECPIYLKSAKKPYNSFIAYYQEIYGVEKKREFASTFPEIETIDNQ